MRSPKSGRIRAGIGRDFPRGDSRKALAMTTDRIERTGFAPHAGERVRGRHCTIVVQLIAAAALVMSIAVTATVVTIGIARADGVVASARMDMVSGCVP